MKTDPWGISFPAFVDHIKDMALAQMIDAVRHEDEEIWHISTEGMKPGGKSDPKYGDYDTSVARLLRFLRREQIEIPRYERDQYLAIAQRLADKEKSWIQIYRSIVKASVL